MFQRYMEALHKPRWELTPADQYVLSTGNMALVLFGFLLFIAILFAFFYVQATWQERKKVKKPCPRCKGEGVYESPSVGLVNCPYCGAKGYIRAMP